MNTKLIKIDKKLLLILLLSIFLRMLWINTLVERDEGSFAYHASVNYVYNNPLYKQQWFDDNKPPFLYFFYSIPIFLFGNNFFYIRMFNNVFFWISCVIFYLLNKKIFENETKAFFSTLIFIILMNLPYFQGHMVMSESIALHFTIFGFYFLFLDYETNNITNFIYSILFLLIATLTRFTLIINFFILLIYLAIFKKEKRHFIIVCLAILPFLAWIFTIKNYILPTLEYHLLKTNYVHWTNWLMLTLQSSSFIFLGGLGYFRSIKEKNKANKVILFFGVINLLLGFLPNSYGHQFISFIPYLAIFSTFGLFYLWSSKFKCVFLFVCFLFISNIFFSLFQYPNMHVNKSWFDFPYSDSNTRNIQEEISGIIKNHPSENVFILGWEPYLCFRSEKPYCANHLPFETISNSLTARKKLNNSLLIVLFEKYIEYYEEYTINFDYNLYDVIKGEEYLILTKKT